MRKSLSDLLCARYPRLYDVGLDKTPWPFRLFGFQHGDGWFGLTDALSSVFDSRVADRCLDFSIIQVKQKFGTLRYYAEGLDDFCRGARAFTERISSRLSERSGRPGLPSRIGRHLCTLGTGEDARAELFPEFEPVERFTARCGPSSAMGLVQSAWPMTHIDVPMGHADLVDVLIGFLTADEIAMRSPSAVVVHVESDNKPR